MATAAPARSMSRAVARPMPELPPVMAAVVCERSRLNMGRGGRSALTAAARFGGGRVAGARFGGGRGAGVVGRRAVVKVQQC